MNVNEQIKSGTLCKDNYGLYIVLEIVYVYDLSDFKNENVKQYDVIIYDCREARRKQTYINLSRKDYVNTFEVLVQ